jgi:hypothetical protein
MGSRPRKVHQMIVLGTLRWRKANVSATEAVLKKLEPTNNKGIRLTLGERKPKTSCVRQD